MTGKMVKKSGKSGVIGTSVAKKILSFFKERNDVSLVFVFGSFVRSEMTAVSDIDVGIYFQISPDFYQVNAIKEDLRVLLKRDVDVAVLNDASPVIKMQVLKKGTLVLETSKNNFSAFYGDTVKQYDDLKQIRKKCEDNILKGRIYA